MFSIICPVFNTSSYLDHCLSSVFKNITAEDELIIINDASTDNSNEVIQRWASKFKNFKYYPQKINLGLGEVRNLGIHYATQQYVIFLDSDDSFIQNSLDKIRSFIQQNPSEIFQFSYEIAEGNTTSDPDSNKTPNFNILHTSLRHLPALNEIRPCWSMIYQRKFLIKYQIKFLRKFFEDHDFGLRCLIHAENITVNKSIKMITYQKRENSITSSPWNKEKFECLIDHYINIFESLNYISQNKFYSYSFINTQITLRYFIRFMKIFYQIKSFFLQDLIKFDQLKRCFQRNILSNNDFLGEIANKIQPNSNPYYFLFNYQILISSLTLEHFEKSYKNNYQFSEINSLLLNSSNSLNEACLMMTAKSNRDFSLNQSVLLSPHIKRIIIHIGAPKAGSTAFQNFCIKNYDLLVKHKILFPKHSLVLDDIWGNFRYSGHDHLRFVDQPQSPLWKKFISQLTLEIQSYPDVDTLILSCENLFFDAPLEKKKKIKNLFLGKEIIIFCNTRDHETWSFALYREFICGGNVRYQKNYDDFLQQRFSNNLISYSHLLKEWQEVFSEVKIFKSSNIIQTFFDDLKISLVNFIQISKKDKNSLNFKQETISAFQAFNTITRNFDNNSYKEILKKIIKKYNFYNEVIYLPDISKNLQQLFYQSIDYDKKQLGLDFSTCSTKLNPSWNQKNFIQVLNDAFLKELNIQSFVKNQSDFSDGNLVRKIVFNPKLFPHISKIYYFMLRYKFFKILAYSMKSKLLRS